MSGFCTELKNPKTGKKEKHCVDAVVTWTPGDVKMGLMLATGGKQATAGSLLCSYGVNLRLIREDNTDNMQAV